MTQVKWTHATGIEYAVDTASLPPKAIDYLLLNGFKQSMGDSVASVGPNIVGTDKAAPKWSDERFAKALAEDNLPSDTTRETYFKRVLAETLAERFKDICEGTVGTRAQGAKLAIPRGDEVAKRMRTMAEKAAATAIGIKADAERKAGRIYVEPTGDALLAIVQKFYEANGDEYRKEAEKAIAFEAKQAAKVNLSGLL